MNANVSSSSEQEITVKLTPGWMSVLVSVVTVVAAVMFMIAGQPSREEAREIARQEIAPIEAQIKSLQLETNRLNRNIETLLNRPQ